MDSLTGGGGRKPKQPGGVKEDRKNEKSPPVYLPQKIQKGTGGGGRGISAHLVLHYSVGVLKRSCVT